MIAQNTESQSLSIRGLSVHYGQKQVVRNVSFDANAGEIFGLLGPSGAGKSSVLAALTGVIPSDGVIQQSGIDISRIPARMRRFGQVYQEFRLFDWMSVRDNVAFPCEAIGWSKQETDSAVVAALDRVNLRVRPETPVRDLSGGERQRVALARALAFQPRALFLDEPFSHLDPPLREELKRDLMMMLSGESAPVVFVTHDHGEAFELCTRIGVMIDGEFVQEGTPLELILAPRRYDVASLLGYSNIAMGRLLAITNGMADVQVDGLQPIWHCRVMTQVSPGTPVQIASRPERLIVSEAGALTNNNIEFRIVSVRTLADSMALVLALSDNCRWTANVALGTQIEAGGSVKCSIASDDLLVYPAANL